MAELERAAEVLAEAPVVAIACHVNPDADALGSMLGLSGFLRARGTSTVCSFPNDPPELPRWARLLPGAEDLVAVGAFPKAPDVMVTCDCASSDRLGPLLSAANRARELIWIDHHRSNEGLGTIRLIDPDSSSTCEMVWRLIGVMGGEVPSDTALCLYAGLVTDTGRFQYEAVRPQTLRIAAELREHAFDHTTLVQALYEDHPRSYLGLVGVALRRLSFVPDVELVWTYVTQADLRSAGVGATETEDLIDLIRTDRAAEVAVLVKQQRDGRFKVSLRSRGKHDLAAVAATFGGGGHRLAAGYTSEHGPAETIDQLADALRSDAVTQ
jgi:phosphoesterase RecJ-like protein